MSEKRMNKLIDAFNLNYKNYEILERSNGFIKVRLSAEEQSIGGFFEFMEAQVQ